MTHPSFSGHHPNTRWLTGTPHPCRPYALHTRTSVRSSGFPPTPAAAAALHRSHRSHTAPRYLTPAAPTHSNIRSPFVPICHSLPPQPAPTLPRIICHAAPYPNKRSLLPCPAASSGWVPERQITCFTRREIPPDTEALCVLLSFYLFGQSYRDFPAAPRAF